MTIYLIVVCRKCGGYLLAVEHQKTRTCPYCGSKVFLSISEKVASAETAEKASELLRKYKENAAGKRKTRLQKPI